MNGTGAHDVVLSIFDGPLTAVDIWVTIGFLGQTLFFMRFLVQWIASEKEGRSIVPEIFWYFSLGGGIILLAYAVYRQDPVFILGQGVGLFVYIRNIMLVWRERREGPVNLK
jgi:lipid-A-disaccharide synthase-like uncharacterized protein